MRDTRDKAPTEQKTWAIIASILVACAIYVDVAIPVFGTSNRLVTLLVVPVLLAGGKIRAPYSVLTAALLVVYYFGPLLLGAVSDIAVQQGPFIGQMAFLLAAVLAAALVAQPASRRVLAQTLLVVAALSSVLALLERLGIIPHLGRTLWTAATTETGAIRGSALMVDPNFLAITLAATVPLTRLVRRPRTKMMLIAIILVGILATNSRTGLVLAVGALLLQNWSSLKARGRSESGRLAAAAVTVIVIGLFAFNVGGQRDRIVDSVGYFIGTGSAQTAVSSSSESKSAVARQELLFAWVDLGNQYLPFGAGWRADRLIFTEVGGSNAAHNTPAQAYGQGGLAGLALTFLGLLAVREAFRRRQDPYSHMLIIVILGGLTVSFPGTILFVLPIALMDGLRRFYASPSTSDTKPASGRAITAASRRYVGR